MHEVVICRRRHRGAFGALRAPAPRHLLSSCSRRGSRAGGVVLSEQSTASRSTRAPTRCWCRSPKASACARSSGWRSPRRRPSRRASPTSSEAAGCIRCRPRRSSASRRSWGPFRSHVAVLVARQAPHGRGARHRASAPTARTNRSARSWTRRFGTEAKDVPRRAAARRHSRGRCRSAVARRLFPRFRRSRADPRQSAPRISQGSNVARTTAGGRRRRRRRSDRSPGGLSEMVDALVRTLPAAVDPPAHRRPAASRTTDPGIWCRPTRNQSAPTPWSSPRRRSRPPASSAR